MAKQKPVKLHSINLSTTDPAVHKRYLAVSKLIRKKGYDIGKILPVFLVDTLEGMQPSGFEDLKGYM